MSCFDVRILDYNYAFKDSTDLYASSENPDFPKENLKDYSLSKVFRTSSIVGEQSIVFDFSTTDEVDSAVLLFSRIEDSKLSPAAVVKLQANATNSWGTPAFEQTLSFDNDMSTMSYFSLTDISYRFWRIAITDPFNAYGYIEFPKLYIGKKLAITRIPEIGFELNIEDLSKSQSTPYGHRYFDIYPNRRSLSFNYNMITDADVFTIADSYERNGMVTPIVVCLDSTEVLFDKDRFLIYGTYASSIQIKHVVKRYFSFPMAIEELI
jgi:hypothetical protein